jgi:hypothetical protein
MSANNHNRATSLNDSILNAGDENDHKQQQTMDDPSGALLKQGKFDPSKYISEDFLQILNEHRKNCEREGKLE